MDGPDQSLGDAVRWMMRSSTDYLESEMVVSFCPLRDFCDRVKCDVCVWKDTVPLSSPWTVLLDHFQELLQTRV